MFSKKPKKDKTLTPRLTPWAEEAKKEIPLAEYPRPQLMRREWTCLNGRWRYAVRQDHNAPDVWDGEIVVPYSPESILSGAEKIPGLTDTLWYERTFDVPEKPANKRLLLHFGAVDQRCCVWVNRQRAGGHEGGYLPFHFDITDLVEVGENTLRLQVIDLCDQGPDPYGKQKPLDKRGEIWYQGQSGIWQTVWTEWVPEMHITEVVARPLYETAQVAISVRTSWDEASAPGNIHVAENGRLVVSGENQVPARIRITENGRLVAHGETVDGMAVIDLPGFRAWSPEDPFLYDLEIACGEDRVYSYFGMRAFGMARGAHGQQVLTLNGRIIFHHGLLDQGYWSDGMYTPPSDEAMIDDIMRMKALGFNMLRKHIKIEPLRWYYHCDRLGMLVWQDFVSGGGSNRLRPQEDEVDGGKVLNAVFDAAESAGGWLKKKSLWCRDFLVRLFIPFVGMRLPDSFRRGRFFYGIYGRRDVDGCACFLRDAERTVRLLKNCVSICCWVPFNEGWGQFDAKKTAELVRQWDDTRYIDHVSGWHDQGAGDFRSRHVYPFQFIKRYYHAWWQSVMERHDRVLALTEFGGLALPVPGHMTTNAPFGYKFLPNEAALNEAWVALYERDVIAQITHGLAVDIYTQVSDVEDEVNGVMTYDRQVMKLSPETGMELRRRIDEAFAAAYLGQKAEEKS